MNEELGTLLVLAYLTESHCPWLVPLGLLLSSFKELFVWGLPPDCGPNLAGICAGL